MKHTLGKILFFIVGIGILGGLAQFMYERLGPGDEYQAVLLTTGDVYFAKVSDGLGRYVTLRDVYYPKVDETSGAQTPDVQLVRLGSELHKPQGDVRVNREHVIMIQPLQGDSPVISTIEGDPARTK